MYVFTNSQGSQTLPQIYRQSYVHRSGWNIAKTLRIGQR